MADETGQEDVLEDGGYELQVYALSPLTPSPGRLVAEAEGGGIPLRVAEADSESEAWTHLVLEAGEPPLRAVRLSVPDVLEKQLAAFRDDREAGEDVPEELFEAKRLYLLELEEGEPGEDEEDEAREAGFLLTAWALASLTEGLIFDPQEEFIADAESFLEKLMDGDAAQAAEPAGS